jgi:hypothetical protein
MTVKSYEVNLEGNMASEGALAAKAVRGLAEALGTLQGAVLGVTVGIGALALAMVGVTDHAINASENVERLSQSFGALSGQGPEAGRKTLDAIRGVATELPQSQAMVTEWAQQLMAVGQTDMGSLRSSLHAIAGAEALLPGGAEAARNALVKLNEVTERGTKFRFNIKELASMGLTEKDFLSSIGMTPQNFEAAKKAGTITGEQIAVAITNALNKKSQGPLEAAMQMITTRITKGKDAIAKLFEFDTHDFDRLAQSVTDFFAIFEDNPSADALKIGIGGAVRFVSDRLADLVDYGTIAFLSLELAAIRLYNATHKIVEGFFEFLGTMAGLPEFAAGLDTLKLGVEVIAGAFVLLAAGAVAATGLVIVGLGAVAGWAKTVGEFIGDAAFAMVQFVTKAYAAGKDFVLSLVKGITDGIAAVIAAGDKMGSAAWQAVKRALDLGSPSRLMIDAGMNTSLGFAQGIDAGSDSVSAAATSMAVAPRAAASGSRGTGGGVATHNEFRIEVHGTSQSTARELYDMIQEEALMAVQERLALTQGVAPVPA